LATYLDKIVAHHRARAAADGRNLDELIRRAEAQPSARGFRRALAEASSHHLAVIAEIKRRSPSKGDLNAGLDAASLARTYEGCGASAMSVLTDEPHFGGSVEDLRVARGACNLPVIRKDFTVDPRDVCDARIMGADCVLLIAAALTRDEIGHMHELAVSVGLDVLVEMHDDTEVGLAVDLGADMIGVNQRDLVTFEVDHERAVRTAASIPAGVVKVAESGVRGANDARSLRDAGYDAVLVGESLVTASNPREALDALRVH